jgi:hypothetical protein
MHRAPAPFCHKYISRGFKSCEGGGQAVSPPLHIHRSWEVLLRTSRTARLKCAEAPSCTYHIRALTSAVQLPVNLADHLRGNLSTGCLQAVVVKHAGLPTISNPCPHINAELLLVSIQYPFSYNSHVDMDFFSCFGMWNSCPKFVRTFQLNSVYFLSMDFWRMKRSQ